jgi:hypothetical protein
MVTIHIKENSKQAKAVLEMLKTFAFVEVVEKPVGLGKPSTEKKRYNATTEKAIQDAKNGIGVTKVKNVADLFKKLNA